jgi:hypothetical protein
MTAHKRPKRRWGTPPLDLSSGLRFVFRREVRLPPDSGPRLEEVAQAVLEDAGFEPVRGSRPARGTNDLSSPEGRAWVGERWLPRRRGTASTTRLPIVTLLLAGCVLGGLDAYISNSLVVAGYWFVGAVGVSVAFWVRYGRTYDTDVAQVTLSGPTVSPPPGPGLPSVVFWASRVRSQVHSGVRVPTGVSGPIWLAAELGELAREFERRMSGPGDGRSPRTTSP